MSQRKSFGVWRKAFGHCRRPGCTNFIAKHGYYHITAVGKAKTRLGPYCSEECFNVVKAAFEEKMADEMMQPEPFWRRLKRKRRSTAKASPD